MSFAVSCDISRIYITFLPWLHVSTGGLLKRGVIRGEWDRLFICWEKQRASKLLTGIDGKPIVFLCMMTTLAAASLGNLLIHFLAWKAHLSHSSAMCLIRCPLATSQTQKGQQGYSGVGVGIQKSASLLTPVCFS